MSRVVRSSTPHHLIAFFLYKQDAIDVDVLTINLAQIYAWTSEKDRAIEQIAAAERTPNVLGDGLLKLHPYLGFAA